MSDKSFLNWPFFTEEHRALEARLDAWATSHLQEITANEHHDLDGTCTRIVRALGNQGFTTYAVPASAGGQHEPLDVRSLCIIRETLARHNALADFAFAMQGLGSGPLSLFGNEAQQDQAVLIIKQGMVDHTLVVDPEINLAATLIRLARIE